MQNYFELFSLDIAFSININNLESEYQTKIANFHPDKYVNKSSNEKSLALQNTSLINFAFDTLKSPLKRAAYLLELKGINAFDEKDTKMDESFLFNQIELREQLESITNDRDEIELDKFIEDISQKVKRNIEYLEKLFVLNEFEKIKNIVRELKFYVQLKEHSKNMMDELL
jgi:molecular chaperone HscB